MEGARPDCVSERAMERQRREMGTLGSGNHYFEGQVVTELFDAEAAAAFGLKEGEVVVTIHCGSRGLGHQIGSDYLKEMVVAANASGMQLPDRELSCAPIKSDVGQRYLGAMRAATNCALANREILGHYARRVFKHFFPDVELPLLFDVSRNTCKLEKHTVEGKPRELFVHRKGATRAFGPGHASLPGELRAVGQPVLIGGNMGTGSFVLAADPTSEERSFSSACRARVAPCRATPRSNAGADGKSSTTSQERACSQPIEARGRGRGAWMPTKTLRRSRLRRSTPASRGA